jgi:hypothetical protein
MFLGAYIESVPLLSIGKVGFVLCFLAAFVAGPVFISGLISGKYKNLPAKSWKDQVW